jgi:hypothetical protein
MNERGTQLLETANAQTDELIGLISTGGEAALRLPCPGREKLGDGTVAACALPQPTTIPNRRVHSWAKPGSHGSPMGTARASNRASTRRRTSISKSCLTDCRPAGLPSALSPI